MGRGVGENYVQDIYEETVGRCAIRVTDGLKVGLVCDVMICSGNRKQMGVFLEKWRYTLERLN